MSVSQVEKSGMSLYDDLLHLLRTRSLKRGEFVLVNRARSNYYFDARISTMSGKGQLLIGIQGLNILQKLGWNADVIGGLTLGADPIAYAIVHRATVEDIPMDAFTVRKEQKVHGTSKLIEGADVGGKRAVVVEDTLTMGESALRAVRAVAAEGGSVIGVLVLLDRQEGGRKRIEEAGFPVHAMYTAEEVLGEKPPPSTPAPRGRAEDTLESGWAEGGL